MSPKVTPMAALKNNPMMRCIERILFCVLTSVLEEQHSLCHADKKITAQEDLLFPSLAGDFSSDGVKCCYA
jgi:hypothetical protein